MLSMRKTHSENDTSRLYGRFPAWGRVGCCSPLVTPDLIRGRLIEPLARLATKVRRPLTQTRVWNV